MRDLISRGQKGVLWILMVWVVSISWEISPAMAMEAHLRYGGPEGFSCEASSLVDRLSRALPGDSDLATVYLSNDSDNALEATLSTTDDHEMNRQDSNSLLEQVSMVLSDETGTFYEGPLDGASLSEGIALGEIPAHTTRTITCEIAIPSNLSNEQALAGVTTELMIMARDVPSASSELPKTGDTVLATPLLVGLLCFGGSLAALTGLVVSGRRLL